MGEVLRLDEARRVRAERVRVRAVLSGRDVEGDVEVVGEGELARRLKVLWEHSVERWVWCGEQLAEDLDVWRECQWEGDNLVAAVEGRKWLLRVRGEEADRALRAAGLLLELGVVVPEATVVVLKDFVAGRERLGS